eukprot:scaffold95188_cov60-Phaeocystis_antarctica.AAC.1
MIVCAKPLLDRLRHIWIFRVQLAPLRTKAWDAVVFARGAALVPQEFEHSPLHASRLGQGVDGGGDGNGGDTGGGDGDGANVLRVALWVLAEEVGAKLPRSLPVVDLERKTDRDELREVDTLLRGLGYRHVPLAKRRVADVVVAEIAAVALRQRTARLRVVGKDACAEVDWRMRKHVQIHAGVEERGDTRLFKFHLHWTVTQWRPRFVEQIDGDVVDAHLIVSRIGDQLSRVRRGVGRGVGRGDGDTLEWNREHDARHSIDAHGLQRGRLGSLVHLDVDPSEVAAGVLLRDLMLVDFLEALLRREDVSRRRVVGQLDRRQQRREREVLVLLDLLVEILDDEHCLPLLPLVHEIGSADDRRLLVLIVFQAVLHDLRARLQRRELALVVLHTRRLVVVREEERDARDAQLGPVADIACIPPSIRARLLHQLLSKEFGVGAQRVHRNRLGDE